MGFWIPERGLGSGLPAWLGEQPLQQPALSGAWDCPARPLWHSGLSPVWGLEPLSCQHWSQLPESPDRRRFQLTPHHESRRVSLPAGQATLALFCQAEETAWLSFFHQPFSLSSSRRTPAPPEASSPRQGRQQPVGYSPQHGERWHVVPGCLLHMLPSLSPQLDLGLGPGFPGPWCRPSGALLQAVGSLLGGFYLRSRRPGREQWLRAVGCAHLRSIRCHVLTWSLLCDTCDASWQRGTVIP